MAGLILFYLFATVTVAAAIGVVACRNIVRASVCLLFTLGGVAGLYFLLDAEFLAAVQLVVYTGGILIIIIFGVMLTSTSPFSKFHPKAGEVALASAVGTLLFWTLLLVIVQTKWVSQPRLASAENVQVLGLAFMTEYLVPFELASVLLLVVMIGSAFVARGRRKTDLEVKP